MESNDLSCRLRRAMEEWGFTPQDVADFLGWGRQEIDAILDGRLKVLDDFQYCQLALLFHRPPHYFKKGLRSLERADVRNMSPADVDQLKTLDNFYVVSLTQELPADFQRRLWKRAMEGSSKRRQRFVITPDEWMRYKSEIEASYEATTDDPFERGHW